MSAASSENQPLITHNDKHEQTHTYAPEMFSLLVSFLLLILGLGITIKAAELCYWLVVIVCLAAGEAERLAGLSAQYIYGLLRWRIWLAWLDLQIALLGFGNIFERHRAFHVRDPVFIRLHKPPTMDAILQQLLAFPPHPPPATPLSDAEYDKQINIHVQNLNHIPASKLTAPVPGGGDLLDVRSFPIFTILSASSHRNAAITMPHSLSQLQYLGGGRQ
jgi:hypothetical protein